MKVTFLGTGTSQGIPVPLCSCPVCSSTDSRNHRLRSSVLVQSGELSILIDTSIDFRAQMLKYRVSHLDAVLQTHHHFDHLFGLDDIRAFTQQRGTPIDFYTSPQCEPEVMERFGYAFKEGNIRYGLPELNMKVVTAPFEIRKHDESVWVTPIEIGHGKITIYGFRIDHFAYLTDCKAIPPRSIDLLRGLDVLVLDCLQYREHPTHLSLEESLHYISILQPKRTYLIHFNHDIEHAELCERLKGYPHHVEPAYDGLVVTLESMGITENTRFDIKTL